MQDESLEVFRCGWDGYEDVILRHTGIIIINMQVRLNAFVKYNAIIILAKLRTKPCGRFEKNSRSCFNFLMLL